MRRRTAAKTKSLGALDIQEGYACTLFDGKPLPKAKSGDKTVSTGFGEQNNGRCTSIRNSQVSIPVVETGETDMVVSEKLEDVLSFYGGVKMTIGKGDLGGAFSGADGRWSEAGGLTLVAARATQGRLMAALSLSEAIARLRGLENRTEPLMLPG